MKKSTILVVEDQMADQRITQRAIEESKVLANIQIVNDGEEALNYLTKKGKFADSDIFPQPDLILLDLHLPKINGQQVLKKISEDRSLSKIPVIILTGSEDEADVCETHDLGASSYIVKPFNFFQFHKCITNLPNYWLSLVTTNEA